MRPTTAYIDIAALKHNMSVIRKAAPSSQIVAVVKANAYGHGAIPVSKAVLTAGASSLAVAIPEEGIELRNAGITAPILVLGLSLPEQAPLFIEHHLTATISTIEMANHLARAARQMSVTANVMIKVDTGMNRVGVFPAQAMNFIQTVAAMSGIHVCGIFTHMASADSAEKLSANRQIDQFEQLIGSISKTGLPLPTISAANSAGIIDLPNSHFSAVRPGIILYGHPPSEEMQRRLDLLPVMELKTRIVYIKKVARGTAISYGGTYTTEKDVYLATLPCGYADGYNRHLSNKAHVLIGGKRRNVVGRVCMDQLVVELGEICDAAIGDEAVLFGRQGTEQITVTELARLAGTISYELLCSVSARVPRIYLNQ